MLKLFLTIQLLLCSLILWGQKVDSVERQLDSLIDINTKIKFLNDWTGKNYRTLTKEATYYSNLSLEYSKQTNNLSEQGTAYVRLGLIAYRKGKYRKTDSIYNLAINAFQKSNDTLKLNRLLVNKGLLHLKNNKLEKALTDFHNCLNFFERKNKTQEVAIIQNNIGLVYKKLFNYNQALIYFKKSAESSNKSKTYSTFYLSNTNIANILVIQGKYSQALEYYKKNLSILKEKPNKYRQAQTFHNIGNCFLSQNKYELALKYFEQSLMLKKEIGNKNLITTTLNSIAHTYKIQKKYAKAIKYSQEAYQLALSNNNLDYQRTSSKDLFKIYTSLKEPDSAIYYFSIYEILKDSLLNKENLKQIAEIQTKYETEKKEAQIALLEKENRNKKMQRNGLLIILSLLTAFAIFMVRSFYKKKKVNRMLRLQKMRIERHKEILDKKNQDLQVVNQTKNKLFQIISHDLRSPLASLAGIAKLIPIFLKQKRYEILDETSTDLEECVDRVLNLTDNLLSWSMNQSGRLPYNPTVLCIQKIIASNIDTYQSVAKQKSIHLDMMAPEDLFVYADRHMLETVVRNLINNAIKFTPDGGVIIVGSKQSQEYTQVWIKDSGVGIPANKIHQLFEMDDNKSNAGTRGEAGTGLGLLLCKDFIERNRGKIWVESTENEGSTFYFTIPTAEKLQEELVGKQNSLID